jgi:hypothetical protein
VKNEGGVGVVYAGVHGTSYIGNFNPNPPNQGLYRSTDGGTSFTQVLPNIPATTVTYAVADLEISASGRIFVGTLNNAYSANRGGGTILYSDDGTTWTTVSTYTGVSGVGRVELACAPSDANRVYGVVVVNSAAHRIFTSADAGVNWTEATKPASADLGVPASDYTRGQAWYDLIIAVKPNDPNVLVVGGIDIFRSNDAGATWSQISKWSNNRNLNTLTVSIVHADIHQLVFRPGFPNQLVSGNDGGVSLCSDITDANTIARWSDRNNGYNVTQFYAGDLNSSSGDEMMIAGAQDNGSQLYDGPAGVNSTSDVNGGDGAFCFIEKTRTIPSSRSSTTTTPCSSTGQLPTRQARILAHSWPIRAPALGASSTPLHTRA